MHYPIPGRASGPLHDMANYWPMLVTSHHCPPPPLSLALELPPHPHPVRARARYQSVNVHVPYVYIPCMHASYVRTCARASIAIESMAIETTQELEVQFSQNSVATRRKRKVVWNEQNYQNFTTMWCFVSESPSVVREYRIPHSDVGQILFDKVSVFLFTGYWKFCSWRNLRRKS